METVFLFYFILFYFILLTVTLFFWAPKSLQMVTAAMKLKDTYSLEGHYFANKGPSSQGYGFSSGHVWL